MEYFVVYFIIGFIIAGLSIHYSDNNIDEVFGSIVMIAWPIVIMMLLMALLVFAVSELFNKRK